MLKDELKLTATVSIYKAGHGVPALTDRGWRWYDTLASTGKSGYCERSTSGRWLTQWVDGVGILCVPVVTPQDSLLTNWTVSGGLWEEGYLDSGYRRVKALRQLDGAQGHAWSVTTGYSLPQDPSFALRVSVADAPPDQTDGTGGAGAATDEPSVWAIWGTDWALEFAHDGGVRVWGPATLGDGTVVRKHLGSVSVERAQDHGCLVIARVVDGEVLLSGDGGWSYTRFAVPATHVPSATLKLAGVGVMAALGLWQVVYNQASYWSPERDTDATRVDAPTITGHGWQPAGTALTNVPLTLGAGTCRYCLRLDPTSATPTDAPWAWYDAPALQGARVEWPAVWGDPAGTDVDLEATAESVEVKEPEEDGAKSANAVLIVPRDTSLTGSLRYRRVEVSITEEDGLGGSTERLFIRGHLSRYEPRREWLHHVRLPLPLECDAVRAKRFRWVTAAPPPEGTVNDAIGWVLDTIGVAATDRVLDAAGDVALEWGSAKAPTYFMQVGEDAWGLLVKLARSVACRIDVDLDGTWVTTPWPPADADPTPWVAGDAPAEAGEVIRSLGLTVDSADALTSVWGYGQEKGRALSRFVDAADYLDPTSIWYVPWDEPALVTDSDTTGADLSAQVTALWEERRPRLASQEIGCPLRWDLALRERYTLPLSVALPGIPTNAIWRLVGTRTLIRPSLAQSGTVASLRWEGDLS